MGVARVVLVVAIVAAAAWAVHRGLLAMERRGWIYYRTRGTGSMGASAMFSFNEVFHPEASTAVVEREEEQRRGPRRDVPGDPPTSGGSTPAQGHGTPHDS